MLTPRQGTQSRHVLLRGLVESCSHPMTNLKTRYYCDTVPSNNYRSHQPHREILPEFVPFQQGCRVKLQPRARLRDLLWAPAHSQCQKMSRIGSGGLNRPTSSYCCSVRSLAICRCFYLLDPVSGTKAPYRQSQALASNHQDFAEHEKQKWQKPNGY